MSGIDQAEQAARSFYGNTEYADPMPVAQPDLPPEAQQAAALYPVQQKHEQAQRSSTSFYSTPKHPGVDWQEPAAVTDFATEQGLNLAFSGGTPSAINKFLSEQVDAAAPLAEMTDSQRADADAQIKALGTGWSRSLVAAAGVETGMQVDAIFEAGRKNMTEFEAGTLTAEHLVAQRAESNRMLKEQFGADAPQALEAARAVVGRDPRLRAQLERYGLLDHCAAVLPIAQHGLKLMRAGRLKVGK